MPRIALVLFAAGALSGCVSHVARVEAPAEPVAAAVGTAVHDPLPPTVEERGAQPREIPISTWRRDEAGNVLRGEALLRTATPWWQRFPADLVSDVLIPRQLEVREAIVVAADPLPVGDEAALTARARAGGYAEPAP
jgi:hypothetical protein